MHSRGRLWGCNARYNVAETAWSPLGLSCLSVWSHRDDVTFCMHMCCVVQGCKDTDILKSIEAERRVEAVVLYLSPLHFAFLGEIRYTLDSVKLLGT